MEKNKRKGDEETSKVGVFTYFSNMLKIHF
jgi:hypothetical protein